MKGFQLNVVLKETLKPYSNLRSIGSSFSHILNGPPNSHSDQDGTCPTKLKPVKCILRDGTKRVNFFSIISFLHATPTL